MGIIVSYPAPFDSKTNLSNFYLCGFQNRIRNTDPQGAEHGYDLDPDKKH